jgi:fatty acid desaturase
LNESYNEPFSILEQDLRKSSRKKTVIGVIMLLSLIALPILVFYIQFLVSPTVVMIIFVIFGAMAMVGLVMVF